MQGGMKNDDFRPISRSISETVIVRWAHAGDNFVSIEFSFHPYNTLRDCPRGVLRRNKNVVKIAILGLTHWLKHRITRKPLNIDRYMLRGVWQALNCLSTRATHCVIIAGASPGETKMWAAVRENGDVFALAVRITGKLLKIDGYMLRGFGKHWIVFSFMQRFAWLPQGRPQGKEKMKTGYVKMTIFLQ